MSARADIEVMIDGAWVESFAHVSGVTWADRFGDGGCGPVNASFKIAVGPGNDSSWLRIGREVAIYDHGVKVFGGKIAEMGRDYPRTIHCKGWVQYVEGEPTVVGHKFGRTAENVTYTPTADTVVSWLLDATGLDIGVADDGLYTRIVATYVDSIDIDGNNVTDTVTVDDLAAQALYDVITYDMDLTDLGLMTATAAEALADAQLAEFTVPQLLSRVVATDQILFNPAGYPAFLPNVRSGQLVEMFNVPNSLGGIQYELNQRFVIGETEHSEDNPGEVPIASTRLAVRNLLDALKVSAQVAAATGRRPGP